LYIVMVKNHIFIQQFRYTADRRADSGTSSAHSLYQRSGEALCDTGLQIDIDPVKPIKYRPSSGQDTIKKYFFGYPKPLCRCFLFGRITFAHDMVFKIRMYIGQPAKNL